MENNSDLGNEATNVDPKELNPETIPAEDVIEIRDTSTPIDTELGETLRIRKLVEIKTPLDFFRHSYSLKGKQIVLSDKVRKGIEDRGNPGNKHDADLADLLMASVLEDSLLQVPPQILISIMGSNFAYEWKKRFVRYLSDSVHKHPMLNAEPYRTALLVEDPNLDDLFRRLSGSIQRFDDERNLNADALNQLRRNSITTFLLIFSIKQRWQTEKFITSFNQYYWNPHHQIDVKKQHLNIASLAKPGRDTSPAIVATVLLRRMNSLKNELAETENKLEISHLRAVSAEVEVEKGLEVIGRRDGTISQLEAQISQLELEIRKREQAIQNAETHHIDDNDAVRTRVLRMLGKQVDLLTDGLHALRKDNKEVAEEFMDRTISSLSREIENLRTREGDQ